MTVKYCIKTHEVVINDSVNKYYSDPKLNAALATAETLFVTAITTNATGTSASLGINAEVSNDGINWSPPQVIISAFINVGSPTYLSGQLLPDTIVVGRYLRFSAAMGGTGVGCFARVWACGRTSG